MRYEIDVDRPLKASVIAAEDRLYQQKWYLSCEISLVFSFLFFSGALAISVSFTEIIPKTPTVCLLQYSISWLFKTNDNKVQYRYKMVLFSIIDKDLKFTSEYQKGETENIALWGENKTGILVSFNFTLF